MSKEIYRISFEISVFQSFV